MKSTAIKKEIEAMGDPVRAVHSLRFFKTGKGEYGEGDKFYGLTVPEQRIIAKKYYRLVSLPTLKELLGDKHHECRAVGLYILNLQYQKADIATRSRIVAFYLRNTAGMNNWDLIDGFANRILGDFLVSHPGQKPILYKFARSKNLWKKRIAIISTLAFISKRKFTDTLSIAKLLLHDSHDLIHKAVGWALREVGKKDAALLETFLDRHAHEMPRTMLRYSLEKFPQTKRTYYMGMKEKKSSA